MHTGLSSNISGVGPFSSIIKIFTSMRVGYKNLFQGSPFGFHQACRVFFFLFFCALRPKSTAMVMAGWSVHLTTLFPGQACKAVILTFLLQFLYLLNSSISLSKSSISPPSMSDSDLGMNTSSASKFMLYCKPLHIRGIKIWRF